MNWYSWYLSMANCSIDVSLLPLSQDYYTAVPADKKYFIYVDVVLTSLVLLLYVEEVHFVIRTYRHYSILVKSLWLITIYPVFAVSALVAVLIPRATYLCDFISACFLSACFFQFSSLILLYFGHLDVLLAKVKDTGFTLRSRPFCCCCLCCPILTPSLTSLRKVRLMILQTAILQPIIQFISAVLWADDKYDRHGADLTQSYLYLTVLKVSSTLVAIWGLNSLHAATRAHLKTHNTAPKHLALQLVQVFFNIQGSLLLVPPRFSAPACDRGFSPTFQMLEWHHLVLVVEMFLVSVLARLYYRRPLEMDAIREVMAGAAPQQPRCRYCLASHLRPAEVGERMSSVILYVPENKEGGVPAYVLRTSSQEDLEKRKESLKRFDGDGYVEYNSVQDDVLATCAAGAGLAQERLENPQCQAEYSGVVNPAFDLSGDLTSDLMTSDTSSQGCNGLTKEVSALQHLTKGVLAGVVTSESPCDDDVDVVVEKKSSGLEPEPASLMDQADIGRDVYKSNDVNLNKNYGVNVKSLDVSKPNVINTTRL